MPGSSLKSNPFCLNTSMLSLHRCVERMERRWTGERVAELPLCSLAATARCRQQTNKALLPPSHPPDSQLLRGREVQALWRQQRLLVQHRGALQPLKVELLVCRRASEWVAWWVVA